MKTRYRFRFPFSLTCLALAFANSLQAQTLLVRSSVELRKSSDYHQALAAQDENTGRTFAFVADKDRLHLLGYNRAFFLRDTLSIAYPDPKYPDFVGYALDGANNPVLLLADETRQKALAVRFDTATSHTEITPFAYIPPGEKFLCSFTQKGIFYTITAKTNESALNVFVFTNGTFETHQIDLTALDLRDEKDNPIAFKTLLDRAPLVKMESKTPNGLAAGIAQNKLYVEPDKLLISLDYRREYTTLLEIDLHNFALQKTAVQFPAITDAKTDLKTNSCYHNGYLFQLQSNDQWIQLSRSKIGTTETPTVWSGNKDSIPFRNGPIWRQTGNRRPVELDNTKKFLKRLQSSQSGLTVYTMPDGLDLITIGGIREVTTTGSVILGVAATAGSVAIGGAGDVGEFFENDSAESVYFEALTDKEFSTHKEPRLVLADDLIAQFLDEHRESTMPSVFHYRDYFILAYYDKQAHEYVLRKFTDGGQ